MKNKSLGVKVVIPEEDEDIRYPLFGIKPDMDDEDGPKDPDEDDEEY